MPPKVKITKNDIISTALELVRTSGEQTLNARAIATALDCSTQPVFSNFSSMQTLREAVIAAAYDANCEFALVEQDHTYGEDPFDCLARSYKYLNSLGLN